MSLMHQRCCHPSRKQHFLETSAGPVPYPPILTVSYAAILRFRLHSMNGAALKILSNAHCSWFHHPQKSLIFLRTFKLPSSVLWPAIFQRHHNPPNSPLRKWEGGFIQAHHYAGWAAGLFGTESKFFHLAEVHENGWFKTTLLLFFWVNIYVIVLGYLLRVRSENKCGIYSFCSKNIQKMVDLHFSLSSLEQKCQSVR